MSSLFLVRHATTAASEQGRNLGRSSDLPLSPAGHELSGSLGRAIREELVELPADELRLVSSPAARCRETMDGIRAALESSPPDVELEPGLLEIDYGDWDGLTAEECRARDPQLRRAWEADPYSTACPRGESGADVAARAFPVLDALDAWLAAAESRCAIVVAHNHVNRLRLCTLMGWPMHEYRDRIVQDPGGYSIVTVGGEMPVIRRINAAPR